ncbi:MAG: hypothetical protein H5T86_10925, partial [Armatimonadetes bacterium]|nr:hypothetical protein [Armatimonadota bacterium]
MEQIRDLFRDPPNSFRPQPFWFLNYFLDHDLLRVQIAEMADKGVGGTVIHPRHGLTVPFMSQAWLNAVQVCLEELAKHHMEAWIYDEDNWPSGFFGGRLTRSYPENRMRYLRVHHFFVSGGATYRAQLELDGNVLICAVGSGYDKAGDGRLVPREPYVDLTKQVSEDGQFTWSAPPGDWLVTVFWECPVAERVSWFRGYYVDTMHPEAMRKFVESTYEPHLRFRDYFGSTIKGFFTDEPGLMIHDAYMSDQAVRGTVQDPHRKLPGITLPWTRDFFSRFLRLKGYELKDRLMELVYEVGDWRKTRCDFFDAVSSWYIEAYHRQLSAWCEEHGLEYIGHTLEDPLFNQVRTQGDQVRVLEQMHRPGLDYLGHGIGSRDNPFRILACKCAASVAHVTGRPRVMCEAFGASGHANTLANRRLDLNFMAVLGVNMIIPHAFYYSFVGLRKTDWPPCEFYHAPFWPWYRRWADYIGRICLVASYGHHVSGVAILSPVKTVAINMVQGGQMKRDLPQERLFAQLSDALLRAHYDYDYLSEAQLERAQVEDGAIKFPESAETYSVVILPALEIISRFAAEKLLELFNGGGRIVALGTLPLEADRHGDDERVREIMAELFQEGDQSRMQGQSAAGGKAIFVADPGDMLSFLTETMPNLLEPDVLITGDDPIATEDVFCSHRTDGRLHLFLVVNTREQDGVAVRLHLPRGLDGRLEEWDLEAGSIAELPVRKVDERVTVPVELGPAQARVFALDTELQSSQPLVRLPGRQVAEIELAPQWDFHALGPNVLILDKFTFTARDRELGAQLGVVIPGQVNSYTTTFEVEGRPKNVRLILDALVPDLPSHVGFLTGRRNLEILLNGRLLPAPSLSDWTDPFYLEID